MGGEYADCIKEDNTKTEENTEITNEKKSEENKDTSIQEYKENKDTSSPQTGDNIIGIMVLMMVSVAVLIGVTHKI